MQSHSSQSVIDKREIYIFSVSVLPYISLAISVKDPRAEKTVYRPIDPVDPSDGLWIPESGTLIQYQVYLYRLLVHGIMMEMW